MLNLKVIITTFFLLNSFILIAEPYYVCTLKGKVKYVLEKEYGNRSSVEKEDEIFCIATGKEQSITSQKTLVNCKSRMYKDIYKGVIKAIDAGLIKVNCVSDFNREPVDSLSFSTEQIQSIKNEFANFTFTKSCIVEDNGAHITADFNPNHRGAVYDPYINHQALILESSDTIQILMHKNEHEFKKLKPLKKAKMELISEEQLKKKAYKNSYDPENTLRYYYSERGGILLSLKRYFYEINELASLIRYTGSHDNGLPGLATGTNETSGISYTFSNCQ